MSLLDEAKKLPSNGYRNNYIGDEEEELVIAYLKGEINSKQLRDVMKKDGVQIYSFIVRVVRQLIAKEKIQLKPLPEEK